MGGGIPFRIGQISLKFILECKILNACSLGTRYFDSVYVVLINHFFTCIWTQILLLPENSLVRDGNNDSPLLVAAKAGHVQIVRVSRYASAPL